MDIFRQALEEQLRSEIDENYVSILIGARQVGKTTLMKKIETHCKKNKISTIFYNLENPHHLHALTGTDRDVFDTLHSHNGVIFIDEFQYLPNATKLFKALVDDDKKIKLFVSGSSSLEIHKHLTESLTGRYRKTIIYPLSSIEFSQQFSLDHYLKWGGLPGLINDKHPKRLLMQILQSYLMKDIKGLIKEENIRAFNHLLYLLAAHPDGPVSVSSLAREIGLSEPTVQSHLDIMSHTFTVFPLHTYAKNQGNELKKIKKYYLYDIGIRNALLNNFSAAHSRKDKGSLAELFVFHELKKQFKEDVELLFWRTKDKDEIDFIAVRNEIPIPIEVKYELKIPFIPPAFIKFFKKYPNTPFAVVLSQSLYEEREINGKTIYFLPYKDINTWFILKELIVTSF